MFCQARQVRLLQVKTISLKTHPTLSPISPAPPLLTGVSILIRAISAFSSTSLILASNVAPLFSSTCRKLEYFHLALIHEHCTDRLDTKTAPPAGRTLTLCLLATTWALVTMSPSSDTTKPEPLATANSRFEKIILSREMGNVMWSTPVPAGGGSF